MVDIRTASAFDVHAFEEGEGLILCGVTIPFAKKLKGHSDADVALHALTDALYGAMGLGDIGVHFPPQDDKWRNADSSIFLRDALKKMNDKGARLNHADVTLISQAPRLNQWRDEMVDNLALLLSLGKERIGLKATTTEQLGFIGRKEGIAALAQVTLLFPS